MSPTIYEDLKSDRLNAQNNAHAQQNHVQLHLDLPLRVLPAMLSNLFCVSCMHAPLRDYARLFDRHPALPPRVLGGILFILLKSIPINRT